MGYYIQVPGGNKEKAYQIETLYNGIVIDSPNEFIDVPVGKALLCVVDNYSFEAIAFCYSEEEFNHFLYSSRPKTWMLIDWDLACKLSGYAGKK